MGGSITPAFARFAEAAQIHRAFDGLVDLILSQFRNALEKQSLQLRTAAEIDALCIQARENLDRHRPQYLVIMEREWTSALSVQELEDVAELLERPIAVKYFSLSRDVEIRMRPSFEMLAQSMFGSVQNIVAPASIS